MKEFVLVEFLAGNEDREILVEKLRALGNEFKFNKDDFEFETCDDDVIGEWYRVSGKISSMYASIIKLQDPFLADRMRISYIPEELKDRYRR